MFWIPEVCNHGATDIVPNKLVCYPYRLQVNTLLGLGQEKAFRDLFPYDQSPRHCSTTSKYYVVETLYYMSTHCMSLYYIQLPHIRVLLPELPYYILDV